MAGALLRHTAEGLRKANATRSTNRRRNLLWPMGLGKWGIILKVQFATEEQ